MFEHSYQSLGGQFSKPATPLSAPSPEWIAWNEALADQLDWPAHWRRTPDALAALAGNGRLEGSSPLATVYAGHQFGSYNPQLGDGRAMLLGEWITPQGERFDVQLKGAGPTQYSRGGDGRSPVGPVVREYLVSEAMHHLGVPTTRALAAVATGDSVYRQTPEPGAVLTRIASSHLRVGTVQYFAMTQGGEGLSELVDYVVERHFPDALVEARDRDPAVATAEVLLDQTGRRLAGLVAQWQSLGFIHGVLNTDNMLLAGETIDYGPCAFMDDYDAARVFSSIDTGGRYAYRNQPGIVHWNLSVLAQCLLPLIHEDETTATARAQQSIDTFPDRFSASHTAFLAAKFGLSHFGPDDRSLAENFFAALAADQLDMTLAFRWLTHLAQEDSEHTPLPDLFAPSTGLLTWLEDWKLRRGSDDGDPLVANERMAAINPVVIPRNHQVARAIAAAESGNYTVLDTLHQRWTNPFIWQSGDDVFAAPPEPQEVVHRTFCGT